MAGLTDTSPEAAAVLIEVYRKMSPGQKWRIIGQTYRDGRALHAAGVRLRNPGATAEDVLADWLQVNFGFTLDRPARRPIRDFSMYTLQDLREVIEFVNALGIPYALGGSLAGSLHGVHRHTRDADLTIDLPANQVDSLFRAFGPDWYVSRSAIEEAARQRSSFNAINTASGFKVDFFVCKNDPFERTALGRHLMVAVPDLPDLPLSVYTAEDLILFKLRWYRLGNEVSEQQWRDVGGLLQVQGNRLDNAYLDRWAAHLGVADLLARARQEAFP
jgi:hypothetical protein